MRIVFLGTGTGLPSAERAAPGLLVLADEKMLLVDAGAGTLRQLAKAGYSYEQLDGMLLTHFHPDHVGELVPYLFAARSWADDRDEPVRLYGPQGLLELLGHLHAAFGRWIEPSPDHVSVAELPVGRNHSFDFGPVRIESMPLPHTPASLGYRLTDSRGRVLAVTGDTDYGPELVALARKADLLVAECSAPDEARIEGHLTPSLVGRAATEAGVARLALVHFYPETKGHDLAAETGKWFNGPVVAAHDFMEMEV